MAPKSMVIMSPGASLRAPGTAWGRLPFSPLAMIVGKAMPSIVYAQYEFPYDGGSETFARFKARKGRVRGLQQMVRSGDYVALRTRMREDGAKTRLYNVVEDPFEENDLAARPEHAELLRRLESILDGRFRK